MAIIKEQTRVQSIKDIVAGKLDTSGEWAKKIKAIKDANEKE